MKKKFEGKVAIITGASSGIGLAIAQSLYNDGAKVYDISRHIVKHDCVKESFEADVNDYQNVEKIIDKIASEEGHIDIFVNNAGFGIAGAIEYSKPENIYRQVNTNLSAYISLCTIVIKYLKQTKGRIVNISSVGGVIPLPYQATYSATKAGIEIFSRALANELHPYKVRVTAILPGDSKTGFTAARVIDNEASTEKEQADIRLSIAKMEKDEQKGMTPEAIAKVVRKVLLKKRPPLRKTVGFGYKCVVFLPRLLSTRMINFIVRKLYCKKAKNR